MNVDNEVIAVLTAATINGNAVSLAGQIDRKLYLRTNEVLEAAGGKWNRRAKAHVFDDDPREILDAVIATGAIDAPKDLGFFPTPPAIVKILIERAELAPGVVVLEPSAGTGNIARAVAEAGCVVDCIELLTRNVETLRRLGLSGVNVVEGDFLDARVPDEAHLYDRVIMNPPFERGADIRHVLHAFRFVKKGGMLLSIMAAGVSFRQDAGPREFRSFDDAHGGTIEPLADGAFKESGTNVRTVLVEIPS